MNRKSYIATFLVLLLSSATAFAGTDSFTDKGFTVDAEAADTWGSDECWGNAYETRGGAPVPDGTKVKVYRRAKQGEAGTPLPNAKGDWVKLGEGKVYGAKGYFEVTLDEAYSSQDYYIEVGAFAEGVAAL